MTLTIDLSKELEAALTIHALAQGVDAAGYARQVLERALGMEEPHPGPRLRLAAACLPSTARHLRPRRSTRIGPICSGALVRTLRDSWCCRYPRGTLASVRR